MAQKLRTFSALALIATLAACATASKFTIENRLQELGLDNARSACVADELESRLNDRELAEFARFTVSLTGGQQRPGQVIESLSRISNDRIARAVVAAGGTCIFAR